MCFVSHHDSGGGGGTTLLSDNAPQDDGTHVFVAEIQKTPIDGYFEGELLFCFWMRLSQAVAWRVAWELHLQIREDLPLTGDVREAPICDSVNSYTGQDDLEVLRMFFEDSQAS